MVFFFFNDTATTEIYTLSLHDALPIFERVETRRQEREHVHRPQQRVREEGVDRHQPRRSEEHTSELQSLAYLVCRLLLEKKNIMIGGGVDARLMRLCRVGRIA